MALSRELAVPGQPLDKSWTLPDSFRYQSYCKKQYETHFPRHAFPIDLYMVFGTIFAPLGQLKKNSWVRLTLLLDGSGWLVAALGLLLETSGRLLDGSWAALGGSWAALGGSWAAFGRLLVALGRLLGQLVLFSQKWIKKL